MEKESKLRSQDSRDRISVVIQGVIGIFANLFYVYYGYNYLDFPVPKGPLTFSVRLTFTLRCLVLPVLVYLLGIITIGGQRFSSDAINPLRGAGSPSFKINQRYLQNTMEQLVLHALAQLALCTWLDDVSIKLLPMLSLLFVIGRIAFWLGYHVAPPFRAFGFMTTMGPSSISLLYSVYNLVSKGPAYGIK